MRKHKATVAIGATVAGYLAAYQLHGPETLALRRVGVLLMLAGIVWLALRIVRRGR